MQHAIDIMAQVGNLPAHCMAIDNAQRIPHCYNIWLEYLVGL